MLVDSVTRKMPCQVCKADGNCLTQDEFMKIWQGITSSVEDLTFKCLVQIKCKDCENLGEMVECGMCMGKQGWPCKVDPHGQHVHPNMGACVDFKKWEAEALTQAENATKEEEPGTVFGYTKEDIEKMSPKEESDEG